MRALASILIVVAACGSDPPGAPPPTDPAALMSTLHDLAEMGEKQAGTAPGVQAGEYIKARFEAIGLVDVHTEEFQFPRWELISKSMAISIDGASMSPGFDVFEASGSGTVANAAIVDVGTASDAALAGKDLTGKVAMVIRDPSFHRSAQYQNVIAAGAAAMLYLSIAPENLRQVGSVRYEWEAMGSIPAITIGADDAATITAALTAGKDVRATIDVAVRSMPATGRNIVARWPGEEAETIVLGAHYDTWFAGSSDNGGGVAELLAVAERRVKRGKSRYSIAFVAFDGEEIGLYGGYDYLREHQIVADEPVLAVINFESPSAHNADISALVHSHQPALDAALQEAHLRSLYSVYAGLELVAQLFGGIIPTDIQGIYRHGIPTVTTAVTNPYYHTNQDTPDKVDLPFLVSSTDSFDDAIEQLMAVEPAELAVVDPEVWTAELTVTTGAMLVVEAVVKDGRGNLAPDAVAQVAVLYDDFFQAATATAMTDASGRVRFELPAAAATMGTGQRFVHFGAGPKYPLVERIAPLP